MNSHIYKKATNNLVKHIKEITGLDPFKNTRKREYIEVRCLMYHHLRHKMSLTYETIMNVMNLYGADIKTHARIIHALNNYDVYMRFSPNMRQWVENLEKTNLGEKYDRAVKLRDKIYKLTDEQIDFYYDEISQVIKLNEAKKMEVKEPQIVEYA
jgi:multidrug efflux pump subunit AcrB